MLQTQQEKHANALPYSTVLLPISHSYTRETAIVLILPFSPVFSVSVPLSARCVLVFGPVLVLVCQRRVLVLPQYLYLDLYLVFINILLGFQNENISLQKILF